ncbi:hypothetical protein [Dyadobacter sp. CY326]|uniref:hypothetical protein n=1 Tax=Dyadobacter sp. CY326 TaxID=2907300 RepID=UPI001F341650|nr:hypothetical protein [Dyadobacter sp. CY326]MCE7065315.1 hypothetical protein [Dyadobacter sp. CY326]
MLVYNTNAAIGKAGFYYNSGTSQNPVWSPIGAEANLALPYAKTGNGPGAAFFIENTNDAPTSSAITGNSVDAIGIRGVSQNGRGVVGAAISNGTGVFASSANTNGTALEVSGPVKISGPGQSPGAGKVLTSDGNGNATWENIVGNVAFRASGVQGGGSEILAPGSTVKVAFANQDYDISGNYNDLNASPHSTFIAPVNGIYHFDLKLTWNKPFDIETYDVLTSFIRTRNGNSISVANEYFKSNFSGATKSSLDLQLIQGDMIHIEVENPGASGFEIFKANEDGHFNGRLVLKQ